MSLGARLEELRDELEEFQLVYDVYKEFFDVFSRLETLTDPDPTEYTNTAKAAYKRAVAELVGIMYD